MSVELGTAIVGVFGGLLTILFRRITIRTHMQALEDPSRAIAPRRQEIAAILVGLGAMGVGIAAFIVWLAG